MSIDNHQMTYEKRGKNLSQSINSPFTSPPSHGMLTTDEPRMVITL